MTKPRVLAACPLAGTRTLKGILVDHVELVFVNTLAGARDVLLANVDIAAVICSVHFDESRMYSLLEYAHRTFPDLPFICVRVLGGEISRMSGDAIALASETLGARAYVDFAASLANDGREAAEHLLAGVVLTHLRACRQDYRGRESAVKR